VARQLGLGLLHLLGPGTEAGRGPEAGRDHQRRRGEGQDRRADEKLLLDDQDDPEPLSLLG
jgi:hypothetical protein